MFCLGCRASGCKGSGFRTSKVHGLGEDKRYEFLQSLGVQRLRNEDFPQEGVHFDGVPVVRTRIFWGLSWRQG